MHADAREISALVAMPRLLVALGFAVSERTRRGACRVHGGRNPSAFSWRHDGRWYCFSCGAGGDKIALVRAVRKCSFREAVALLAALAGVEFRSFRMSRKEIAQTRWRRTQAERAAWKIVDEVGRFRRNYADALHRAERLCWRIGERLRLAFALEEQDACWDALARLCPAQTFFLAAWNFFFSATADALTRGALASPGERRKIISTWESAK